MSYVVRFKRSANKELARIPEPDRLRTVEAIRGLGENPNAGSVLRGKLQGLRRVRVGAWRVVYEVDHEASVISILRVARRRDAYRRRA